MVECSFTNQVVVDSISVAVTQNLLSTLLSTLLVIFLIKAFSLMVLRNIVKQKLYYQGPTMQGDLFNKNSIDQW